MVRARWWPAVIILVLGALSLAQAWLLGDTIRQYRVVQTIQTTILVVLALLGWLLFASRLARRVRLGGLAAVLLALGLLAALFRVQGLSGDLVPILKARWSPREESAPTPMALAPTVPPRATPPAPRVADYPQFLGPNRDATLDVVLERDWSAHPPRRLWRQRIGPGWSAFAVAGAVAVTQVQRGPDELVVAYEVGNGKTLWSHSDRARYETLVAGIGPRATPTIVGSRVYTLGATGILNALDLATGRRLWTHRVVEEAGAKVPDWGKSCSPLVIGHRVVVSAGGSEGRSLVAYDAETGKEDWSAGSDRSSYSSPVLATLAGRAQILMFNHGSVAAHDPETGAVLWEAPWSTEQPNVANPLPLPGDRVLLSAGYGVGAKLFRVEPREDGASKRASSGRAPASSRSSRTWWRMAASSTGSTTGSSPASTPKPGSAVGRPGATATARSSFCPIRTYCWLCRRKGNWFLSGRLRTNSRS